MNQEVKNKVASFKIDLNKQLINQWVVEINGFRI